MGRKRRRAGVRMLAIALLIASMGVVAWYSLQQAAPAATSPPPRAEGVLRMHYVSVGQGDGVVWELPGGAIALYDCGPPARTAEENPIVAYLEGVLGRAPGSPIHALIASHGHLDHVGGCDEVVDRYHVENVYDAWFEGADAPESYQRFQAKVRAENATLHTLATLRPGARLDIPGVEARLLWPSAFSPGGWDNIAEASLVVRVRHGASSFCFQGDIETAQERALAADVDDAKCDAYLVGHHGSREASSEPWLARMDPDMAVASFGENPYGHPTPDALCRIQTAGATIYATHRETVVLASDGSSVRVDKGTPETVSYCAEGASYWG